jgi:hypothetical protein
MSSPGSGLPKPRVDRLDPDRPISLNRFNPRADGLSAGRFRPVPSFDTVQRLARRRARICIRWDVEDEERSKIEVVCMCAPTWQPDRSGTNLDRVSFRQTASNMNSHFNTRHKLPTNMALPLQAGLTPMEVAFLCEMEMVTVVPRQRLESLNLLSVRSPRHLSPSLHFLLPPLPILLD